jgi:uncharacterized C2H2 Zn-finger protein
VHDRANDDDLHEYGNPESSEGDTLKCSHCGQIFNPDNEQVLYSHLAGHGITESKANEDAIGSKVNFNNMILQTPYDEQQGRLRNARDEESPLDNIYSSDTVADRIARGNHFTHAQDMTDDWSGKPIHESKASEEYDKHSGDEILAILWKEWKASRSGAFRNFGNWENFVEEDNTDRIQGIKLSGNGFGEQQIWNWWESKNGMRLAESKASEFMTELEQMKHGAWNDDFDFNQSKLYVSTPAQKRQYQMQGIPTESNGEPKYSELYDDDLYAVQEIQESPIPDQVDVYDHDTFLPVKYDEIVPNDFSYRPSTWGESKANESDTFLPRSDPLFSDEEIVGGIRKHYNTVDYYQDDRPDFNNDPDFEGKVNGVSVEPSQYTQSGMDHTDYGRGDIDESKANENKTYTCDKCGKVGDSFIDMAQEECPADVNANHQIPIFGDQLKSKRPTRAGEVNIERSDGSMKIDGKNVIKIWETMNGWYHYAVEDHGKYTGVGADGNDVEAHEWFGYTQGDYNEWGYFDSKEFDRNPMVWEVPKSNWGWTGRSEEAKASEGTFKIALAIPEEFQDNWGNVPYWTGTVNGVDEKDAETNFRNSIGATSPKITLHKIIKVGGESKASERIHRFQSNRYDNGKQCPECNGTGEWKDVVDFDCPRCNGTGQLSKSSESFDMHTDAGHGWLEVPKSLVKELGIGKDISMSSYQKGNNVFIEEDGDFVTFKRAYEEKYGSLSINELPQTDDESPIRDYYPYSGEAKASEAGLEDHSCPECGFITSDNSDYVDHLNAHED